VDDSNIKGRQGRQRLHGGDELPAFPPGPNDFAAWDRVLSVRPDLMPALTQCEVRGMASRLGHGGMDLTRAARLRLTGNGVVPAQAAYAFAALAQEAGL
jgi:DNA (cytosine-5)-methyltransferase 1